MYCTVVARLAWRRWCCWIRLMWYMGNIIRRSQVLKSRRQRHPILELSGLVEPMPFFLFNFAFVQ
jgi:hypothetical protein